MISWIQKTFQHHFRTIFMVLLGLVIVAFVFTIGASPGLGRADHKRLQRQFFDLNLGSQEDQERLFGDAGLSVYLQLGYPSFDNAQLQEYALQRYAGLHLAGQLNVPAPSDTELGEFIKGLRGFAGADGNFDPKRYAEFRDSLKTNPRLNEADVSRVLADDYRYNRVQKLLGGPGYVLPEDVKAQLTRADSSWTIAVATADYKAFAPELKPTDADLTKFFDENSFRYEIPAQVRVRYAEFPSTAFVSQVNVTDAEVRAYYDANPARFPKPATPTPAPQVTPAPATPDADFAAVRPQVEAALKLERAQRLAAKAASDLTLALYEGKVAAGNVESFLSGRSVPLKTVAPFSREAAPAELGSNPQVAAEAFKLSEERYFSDALTTPAGAVVLFWQESIPARTPVLAEVRDRVTADYLDGEKRKRFVALGQSLRDQLTARLKAGDTFEKAAGAVSALKLEVKTYGPFTRRQPPQDLDYAATGALETLKKGEVSQMITSGDKGLLVYAVDQKVPDLTEANPQYVTTRTQLAQFTAARNAADYLREMVEKELAKSAPATP
ncbi:MAG TPA: peptidyl-prolyl cis-trans isomerase [Opitutaceae bacterium]